MTGPAETGSPIVPSRVLPFPDTVLSFPDTGESFRIALCERGCASHVQRIGGSASTSCTPLKGAHFDRDLPNVLPLIGCAPPSLLANCAQFGECREALHPEGHDDQRDGTQTGDETGHDARYRVRQWSSFCP